MMVASAQEMERVTLQLKWKHQFQFAGYYAALAKGYYREAGLDVRLLEAQAGRDPTHEVLAGGADYGVGNSDLLLLRHRGEPVVVLAAIFQHSPMVLLVRGASGVTDLQGLHDRELMMLSSESAELFAYFKFEGIDPVKLHIRPHSLNIEDFIEGRVDGMSAYGTDEPFNLRQRNVPFLQFTPRAGGIDFYGDNLFTTEKEIRDHPERVRAFRAASLRGWEYALQNPDEIIDLILRDYSQRFTREHLKFEADQTIALMHPGLIEVGHMNPGRWRHMADTYAEFGMLPREFAFKGFLYDPNPEPDLRWAYWAVGVLAVLTLTAVGWVLPLWRLNRNLRAAKEAAEKANEAKSAYLAFITHELRTPLNGMVSTLDLLGDSLLDTEQQTDVNLLKHSSHDLLRLIDSVLDVSKLEAGKFQVELMPIDPVEVIDQVVKLYRATASVKNLSLTSAIETGESVRVITDPTRLRQILANLLANALKFTSQGGVVLRFGHAAIADQPGKRLLKFHIEDTGIGIPEAQQATLFDAYAQGDITVARRFGGTGLGLSIARQLARLLGGDVSVSSIEGQGATFTVEIVADEAR